MFSYSAYSLGIHSFLPLPELIAGNGNRDVIVRLGRVDETDMQPLDDFRSCKVTPEETYYFLEGVGRFRVHRGQEVIVDPNPGVDERALRLCLLGPIIALVLYQRGRLILHASAVTIKGHAVAFLGGHGCGKSTLAAALHTRGYDLLADDLTAVDMRFSCPMVLPSFPEFKLWPDSVKALGKVPEAMPLLHPDAEKRAWYVNVRFAQGSLPLRRIYILNRGITAEIEPLSPQKGLRELLCHWYGGRFSSQLLHVDSIVPLFFQCVSLANTIKISSLKRPASRNSIHEIARLVEEDFACG